VPTSLITVSCSKRGGANTSQVLSKTRLPIDPSHWLASGSRTYLLLCRAYYGAPLLMCMRQKKPQPLWLQQLQHPQHYVVDVTLGSGRQLGAWVTGYSLLCALLPWG
jgi:hypothetical protein